MSIAALLQATRDQLQQSMTFPGGPGKAPFYVEIQPQGRPSFDCGEWYVGLDELRVESRDRGYLQEAYTIVAVISARTGRFAPDQRGSAYLQHLYGLEMLERQVITTIHGNQNIRIAANANYLEIAPPSTAGGDIFTEPLWYTGRVRSEYRGGDWAGDKNPESDQTFLVRTLPFTGGLRIQALDIMQ
jgi:hypothetical protein